MNSGMIDQQRLQNIGYDPSIPSCASFLVLDQSIMETINNVKGVEVIPLDQALNIYPHVKESLYFGLIDRDKNEITRMASQEKPVGYYIRVRENVRIEDPLQSAFLLGLHGSTQVIHNIIELEEGAQLFMVNGCSGVSQSSNGKHIGITEAYVGKNATLGYTMLHNWGPDMEVYPVGAARVDEGGHYISNYVSMNGIKKIVSYPSAFVGTRATAQFSSIIYAPHGSFLDMGAKVILDGIEATGEIISRVVSDGGKVISRQMIEGRSKGTMGHMECSGLLLNDEGYVHSIPELKGINPDTNLSHEASVGRISDKDLSYLMTRSLSEDQARSLILRGFLDLKVEGMPEKIQAMVDTIIQDSLEASM
ncbi:MAG: SufD family Fe-S cluster assembly protein [Thermodesulfobacteriota bacterium]|nr:SufD family Fe-S cluster assembly protein [Thermodesulfobacteriota bacterium]